MPVAVVLSLLSVPALQSCLASSVACRRSPPMNSEKPPALALAALNSPIVSLTRGSSIGSPLEL